MAPTRGKADSPTRSRHEPQPVDYQMAVAEANNETLLAAVGGAGRRAPLLLPLISELYIVDKRAQLVRLGTVLKPDQLDFIERCQNQLDTTGQIRAIILKARQIGISTIVEAIAFVMSMLIPNFQTLIVSHRDQSSAWILGMTRRYWETFVFSEAHDERYNGRAHLAWNNHSDMHIATARTLAAGRSATLHFLHASEVAFWLDPKTLMDGLLQSVPDVGMNCVFIESTANGVGNWFHQQCTAAMKRESSYEFFFYPWYRDPEYTADILKPADRKRYALRNLTEEELTLRHRYNVTDSQLIWRRYTIANKLGGSVDKFHQEYPTTPHEAFISSGRNVFNLPKLLDHYDPLEGEVGSLELVGGRIRFARDPNGPLRIFAWPADDDWGVYLCGGDPTHTTTGDFACVQVISRRTLEQVAVYRRKTDPITFGKDMQMIGSYYNKALLAPEKEGPGYATVGCIIADFYPNVYQTTKVDKMQGKPTLDVAGWSTNSTTKHFAIQHLVRQFNESLVQIPRPDGSTDTFGLVIHDEITLMELRDYVTSERGLGYENSDGSEYDDGVMALAIAVAVHVIEPKPDPYEAIPEHEIPARARMAPRSGSGPVVMSGTARPVDSRPRDTQVRHDDTHDEPDPEAPWEAWGRPRGD